MAVRHQIRLIFSRDDVLGSWHGRTDDDDDGGTRMQSLL
jgi:hypothetical protein